MVYDKVMDISIIEWIFYGLIGYSGCIMMIAAAFREVPSTKAGSIGRIIWLLPAAAAMAVLAGSGVDINLEIITTVNTITDNQTSTVIFTEDIIKERKITLQNPMWILFHSMMAFVMIIYIFLQFFDLLGKKV